MEKVMESHGILANQTCTNPVLANDYNSKGILAALYYS